MRSQNGKSGLMGLIPITAQRTLLQQLARFINTLTGIDRRHACGTLWYLSK